MKERKFDTISQTEAMLNELKGNLFEYLVALSLARIKGIEGTFVRTFSGQGKKQFIQYENWIRDNAAYLLEKLPLLAQKTAMEINRVIPRELANIRVVGKQLSESAQMKGWVEGDILLEGTAGEQETISLKLCKANAFVNTKSAGVRSFIKKYFQEFASAEVDQVELSKCVDEEFQLMGHQLYEQQGLNFEGSFDEQWTSLGLSELPGQLQLEQREIIFSSYQNIIDKIFCLMAQMRELNQHQFFLCLQRLMGFSSNSTQVICSYSNSQESKYQFKNIHITRALDIAGLEESMVLKKLRSGVSSFEIAFKDRILQIRIKPMNRFTTSAYKINCSIKLTC